MKRVVLAALVLLLVAAGGCGPGGLLDLFGPSEESPVIDSFTAEPVTISAGGYSTLSWKVSGASSVRIDQGVGNVALTGTRAVTPTVTTVYTLIATTASGKSATATAQVTVSAPATAPVVRLFLANPPAISSGDSSTLSWDVSGATSVTIAPDVGGVAATGNTSVSPSSTATYTLTATNAAGSATATAQVEVSGSVPTGPPVIVRFTASPPSIHPGETSVLSWEVSGATTVALDRGIGPVAPTGTRSVSVLGTTNYTLTASNAYGHVFETIPVVVTDWPSSDDDEPDLIVTTITKVAYGDGYIVGYSIMNQGEGDSPTTTAKLYVEGVLEDSDSIPALDAGESISGTFTSWTYEPMHMAVKVIADADDDADEEDEDNNEKAISLTAEIVVNFVDKANLADWKTGNPLTSISFGGALSDSKGFACHRTNVKLEDGDTYAKVLETHPRWVSNGWIHGMYPSMTIPQGAWFVADVGFLSGATGTDGVTFLVWFLEDGYSSPKLLNSVSADYDSGLDRMEIDLSSIVGDSGSIGLEVLAGSSSGQDWAVWARAMLLR
jgi:hypothetical protein